MNNKVIFVSAISLLLLSSGIAFGATDLFISRSAEFNISEATNNNPIISITEFGPIESQEDDVMEITNNYDSSIDITVEVYNQNDELVDTDSVFISSNETEIIQIGFEQNLENCEDANREFEYTYEWFGEGDHISIDNLEGTFTVCTRVGGPGGGGPPGGGPGGGGPPGQQ